MSAKYERHLAEGAAVVSPSTQGEQQGELPLSDDISHRRPDGNPQLGIFNNPSRHVSATDVGRGCRRCPSEDWIIGPGAGPHVASLSCAACGAHGGWLSRFKLEELMGEVAL
jgi:hypothetical protein